MAHDVFISHSARDKPFADAVCAKLESRNIRCWIAPRDIRPGMEWGAALIEAIDGARVMLLVFSQHANGSPQISREVERAVSKGLIVMPVRVEDIKPTGNLEYFLGTPHWLDAIAPPFAQHLDYIADSAKFWLERLQSDSPTHSADTPPPAPSPQPVRDLPPVVPSAEPDPTLIARPRSRPKWIVPTIAMVLIAVLGIAGYFGSRRFIARQGLAREQIAKQAAAAQRQRDLAAEQQREKEAAQEQERSAAQAPAVSEPQKNKQENVSGELPRGHLQKPASKDFHAAIERMVRGMRFAGPRVSSVQWPGQLKAKVLMDNFPIGQMPPFARIKFLIDLRAGIDAAKRDSNISAPVELDIVDSAGGSVMETIVQ